MDEDATEILNLKYLISTAFLCGLPTSRSTWVQVENLLNELVQCVNGEHLANLVIQSTIRHSLALKYPRNHLYIHDLLEWFIQLWNKYQWTGVFIFNQANRKHDGVKDEFKNLELGYKSYSPLGVDTSYITLLESYEGITKGTTGLSSWGASKVLSMWCLENSEAIMDKNIIELGAGIGYTAASILSTCDDNKHPRSYTATDYHPHVLSILHHNLSLLQTSKKQSQDELIQFCLEMNLKMTSEELPPGEFREWKEEPGLICADTPVHVKQLDWRDPGTSFSFYDIILAADVVYAPHLFPDLVRVIRTLLTGPIKPEQHLGENSSNQPTLTSTNETGQPCLVPRSTKINIPPKAYLACTRRNQETLSDFLSQLSDQGLRYKMIFQTTLEKDGSVFSYNESYKPIKIFEIVL